MGSFTREVRQIIRKLLRTPSFTGIAVLTLAVGIGANTAIFSVVEGVLLRPLPYPDADRLVGLWHTAPGMDIDEFEQSNTSYTLYRERSNSFEEIGLVGRRAVTLTANGTPARIRAATATASLFRVLGVPPIRGRTFAETDDDPGGPAVAVVSYDLWTERFGQREDLLGQSVSINNEPFEVIGVMPPGFQYPSEQTQLWTPHVIGPEDMGLANFSYWGVGRLKPDASVESAAAEFASILPLMPEVYPGEITAPMMEGARFAPVLRPMKEDVVGDVGTMLWILLGTVSFVLLIACANVANLFLVRAEGRQREMAVRTAMGAGWGDVLRAYLTESTALSLIGGAVGVVLAFFGVRLLVAMGPETLPRLGEIGLSGTVLAFTILVSVLAGLLFGAVPAIKYGRPRLGMALKEGGRGGSMGKDTHRANNTLVAAQVALALMLLIGSGLMARSFLELRQVDPGFDEENLITFDVAMIPGEVESNVQSAAFFQELLDNVRALPAVVDAGGATSLPLQGGWSNNALLVEGRPLGPGELPEVIQTNMVTPQYFETMGIRLLEGRTIERQDNDQKTDVAVISKTAAEKFWPGESALGKRVAPGLPIEGAEMPWMTIVGVVDDVLINGLAQPPIPMVYYPFVTSDARFIPTVGRLALTIRTVGDASAVLPALRNEVWAIDSRLPVANVQTGADLIADAAARTSFTVVMLGIAAVVALLLGTIGVYGVISYIVSRRLREFGIRMAMGAAETQIRKMVVRQGLIVALIGVGIGLLGGFVLTRLMQTLLFGVSATDPVIFGGFAAILLGVSAFASWMPARRASSVDPAEALRYE
jgi:putative ABC transport system permease protein